VFHLAARKSVNDDDPRQQFEKNTTMTYNVLKTIDDKDISEIAFTSSSTVYGDPSTDARGLRTAGTGFV
jgi:UDP-glucose 4-epimerase